MSRLMSRDSPNINAASATNPLIDVESISLSQVGPGRFSTCPAAPERDLSSRCSSSKKGAIGRRRRNPAYGADSWSRTVNVTSTRTVSPVTRSMAAAYE